MIRCSNCLIPDTRPDTQFVNGVCAACIAYANQPRINWAARKRRLEWLLEERGKNGTGYDCIVPSSGGKDSHYQVLTLLELGAKPLVVTASTCHLTEIGRKNIDNLSKYATTIEVSPNKEVRTKLNRLGLELVGDISWPEHVSIFTTPFRVAVQTGIPLIFYGENPQNHYGGPLDSQDAMVMTRRWVSEFGGFLGLRPADLVGVEDLTEHDMVDYMPPSQDKIVSFGVEAHFLGQYLPWDSHENARKAISAGMRFELPSPANYWPWENLDNAQTGIHDFLMFKKYGYGRGCAQLSVDIRSGRVDRQQAVIDLDRMERSAFPSSYAGVDINEILGRIGMDTARFQALVEHFDGARA